MPKDKADIINDKIEVLLSTFEKNAPDVGRVYAELLSSLASNPSLKGVTAQILTSYYDQMVNLRGQFSQGKITQAQLTDNVQRFYTEIDKALRDATLKYISNFQTQNAITDSLTQISTKGSTSTFVLTDYICYLAGVSVTGSAARITNTLTQLTSFISGTGGATSNPDSGKASATPKKTAKELADIQATKTALQMIWQSNEGSIGIKNGRSPSASKIIAEITRVRGDKFFSGQQEVVDSIKSLCGLPFDALESKYDNYISGGLRDDKDLFRGISASEYAELIKLASTGGRYTPNVYLASTTSKDVATNFGDGGKFVIVKGSAAFMPNRVYTAEESEYIFPKNANFRVTISKDGLITLTEVPAAAAKVASIRQKLIDTQRLLTDGVRNITALVDRYSTDGATKYFAPQSFLVDDAEGVCDSLTEAWLYAQSLDDNGTVKKSLLDSTFLQSQALVHDAATQGRLPDSMAEQSQRFLDSLTPLHSSGERTIQTLDDIVQSLVSASGDLALSVHTGNHALALSPPVSEPANSQMV